MRLTNVRVTGIDLVLLCITFVLQTRLDVPDATI